MATLSRIQAVLRKSRQAMKFESLHITAVELSTHPNLEQFILLQTDQFYQLITKHSLVCFSYYPVGGYS